MSAAVFARAYVPGSSATVLALAGLLSGTLLAGLGLSRGSSWLALRRASAWSLALGATFAADRLGASEPAGFRMLALCLALLFAMKAVVSVEDLAAGSPRLSPLRWLAFALAWPGMKPRLFASLGQPPLEGAGALAGRGLARLGLGLVLLGLGRALFLATGSPWLATLVVLPGLSLVLHFGVFHLAAALWRALGAPVGPQFVAPLAATSLEEFWGRRWNLAFSDMGKLALYRPLRASLGRTGALLAVFLFSGVVHEVAISVPARGGHGLPTLFFALQGALVLVERALAARGLGLARHPLLGRVWTLGWLAAPLLLVFHPPFLRAVVWPLVGIE